jgi:hypothetical protein
MIMTPLIDFEGAEAAAPARSLSREGSCGRRFEGRELVARNSTRNDNNRGSCKINQRTGAV